MYHDSNSFPVALRMGLPLRSPQMWASGRCNSAKISSFHFLDLSAPNAVLFYLYLSLLIAFISHVIQMKPIVTALETFESTIITLSLDFFNVCIDQTLRDGHRTNERDTQRY